MNTQAIIKIAKTVGGVIVKVGVPMAINFYNDKMLDKKVADAVAKATENLVKKES